MNKKLFIVCKRNILGGNPTVIGVFDSLDAAITNIIDNGGYSQRELNCVDDIRRYISHCRYTPDFRWNYSIHERELNEWDERI